MVFSPFVPDSKAGHAGGAYLHTHLTELHHHFNITMICPDTEENLEALERLQMKIRVVLVPKFPSAGIRSIRHIDNLFRIFSLNLLTKTFLTNVMNNQEVVATLRIADSVEFQWGEMAGALGFVKKTNARAETYVFAQDVISQRNKRILKTSPLALRPLLYIYFKKISWLEAKSYRNATRVAVYSGKDQRLLKKM